MENTSLWERSIWVHALATTINLLDSNLKEDARAQTAMASLLVLLEREASILQDEIDVLEVERAGA